jgi:YHS domain-containing protein
MTSPAFLLKLIKVLSAVLILGLAAGCATRNELPDGAGSKAILAGHDPVTYHTGARPERGNPTINTRWDGGTYYFANEANRELFLKSPQRYAPEYGGYCANGAPYSVMLGGAHDAYKIVDGRLYMFSGPGSLATWAMDERKNIELGDQYWKTEMKDTSSAFVHSWWRVIFAKVPHYKTGKELNAELAARQAKKN